MARVFAYALAGASGFGAMLAFARPSGAQGAGQPVAAPSTAAALQELTRAHNEALARIHTETEKERARLAAAFADSEARMKAEDPTGTNKRAQGERWRSAKKERDDALDALNRLNETRDEQLRAATKAHEVALGVASKASDEASKSADAAARAAEANARAEYLGPIVQSGLAIGLGVVGAVLGRKLGKGAVDAAKATIGQVRQLGKDAAAISKSGGVIANTPSGEAMRGIVKEAKALGGKDLAFKSIGATPKAANVVQGVVATEGVINTAIGAGVDRAIGYDLGISDQTRSRMLAVGAGSLGLAAGMKLGITGAKAQIPRPPARALAAIRAGEARLAREMAGKSAAQIRAVAATNTAKARGLAVTAQSGVQNRQIKAQIAAATGQGQIGAAKVKARGAVQSARAKAATAGLAKVAANRPQTAQRALPPPTQAPMAQITAQPAVAQAVPASGRAAYVTSRGQTVYGTPAQIARWQAQKKG